MQTMASRDEYDGETSSCVPSAHGSSKTPSTEFKSSIGGVFDQWQRKLFERPPGVVPSNVFFFGFKSLGILLLRKGF